MSSSLPNLDAYKVIVDHWKEDTRVRETLNNIQFGDYDDNLEEVLVDRDESVRKAAIKRLESLGKGERYEVAYRAR